MNFTRTFATAAAAVLIAAPQVGWTTFDPVNDDTDIFLANPTITAERPNVLIFIDNTANWTTPFATEKSALVSVVNSLDSNFNVGTMMFVETGNPNDTVDGAYVRFGIRQMTDTNKAALAGMVSALDVTGDKGNNATMSLAMLEIFRYFSGGASYSGFGKVKRDYAGNTAYNSAAASLPGNPFTSASSTTYVSPIVSPCQKNFVIVISNGPFGDNSSSLSIAQTDLAGLVGKSPPDTITISPNGEQGIWADEYAKFFANSDCAPGIDGTQNILTYTLDVLPKTVGQGPSHTAMLQSMASNGKGKYFAITDTSTTDQLINALNTIFQEVQAVNSVFASTTLPVSVNVRGTNLNQVYIGVFRPDSNKSPRWLGNLKLYKLGVSTSTGSLFLADATGAAAENASTGFITGSATSYWTASSNYWGFRSSTQNGVGGNSDSPDGDLVEKGGAAQQIRLAYPSDQSTRKLYTCVNAGLTGPCAAGAALSTMPFNNTKVQASDLGAFTSYTVSTLTSSSTTATLTLPAAPAPTWSSGDQIVVNGAGPSSYNGTYNLTSADNTNFIYTYTLAAALPSDTARASATNHGLNSGDLVSVSGATNTTFNTASDQVVDRRDANTFRYSAPGVSGTNGAITVTGKKLVTSLTAPGGIGSVATAVIPSHGYGSTGSTVSLTFSGATPTAFNNGGSATTVTISDANTVTYVVSGTLTGTGTVGRATAASHGYSNGQTITVQGANEAPYDTTATISLIDANTFTYTLNGTAPGAATGTTILALVPIKYITHPGTGSSQDTGTVTLYGSHGWTDNQAIFIVGTPEAGYNATTIGRTITNATTRQAAGQFDIAARVTNEIKSISTNCYKGSSADPNPTGFSSCTVAAGMYAGRQITALVPIVGATGTIYAGKSVSVQSLSALTNATGAITAGRTVDSNNTLRDQIIAWVRGADNMNDEDPNTTPAGSDIRPSVHGDVLHSRPAVVNYNRYGDDNDIYAFYGSNDGVIHGLKGGITNHTTGPDTALNPGIERWGFIPREFFPFLQRLRTQTPTISNINQKDYFGDGSIAVFQQDARGNGSTTSPLNCVPGSCSGADTVTGVIGDNIHPTAGDKVYLYLSMRRGGSFMYALDATNPATPTLLWRKSSSDTGWEQLGQTWSDPKVSSVAASIGNSNNPKNVVLILGAGYDDTVEDINPCLLNSSSTSAVQQVAIGTGSVTYTAGGSCTVSNATGSATTFSRTKGRGILIVDAFDGTVIWQASAAVSTSSSGRAMKLNVPDMNCAIASDTTVLDKNRDGFADRVYVGDTCGQVWRVDISNIDMQQWTVTKLAALSSSTATDIANKRKFLFPPDLVFGTDGNGNYTAVLMGSGDREHPFDTTATNRFYMIKDRDSSDPGNPQSGATNSSSVKIAGFSTSPTGAVLTDADLFDATNAFLIDGTDPLGLNGWKITLAGGEKVVSSPTSVAGTTFFNTNQPSSTAGGGACGSNLGIAREYQVGFADASATADLNGVGGITIADRSTIHAGGGYLPSPVPVVVEIDGKKYQAVISGTSVQTPPGLTLEKRTRQYWYKQID